MYTVGIRSDPSRYPSTVADAKTSSFITLVRVVQRDSLSGFSVHVVLIPAEQRVILCLTIFFSCTNTIYKHHSNVKYACVYEKTNVYFATYNFKIIFVFFFFKMVIITFNIIIILKTLWKKSFFFFCDQYFMICIKLNY